MKMKKWIAILIGVVISGSTMAENWDWDGDAAPDSSWNNPTNWKNNVFYRPFDLPIFKAGDFATVPVGVNFSMPSKPLRVGQDTVGSAEVQILGGDLTIQHNAYLGFRGIGVLGIMTVSNGSFTVSTSKDLTMSDQNSSGTLNMYGGTVNVSRNLRLRAGTGTSTIGLYDGKLITQNFTKFAGANVAMTVESGLLEVGIDVFSNITAMVTAGDITGNGSNGGADVSAYSFVTNSSSGDLNWGVSIVGTTTNTVVYTVGVAGAASLSLNPSALLDMTLTAPATTAADTVDASFVYGIGSNNVEITDVFVADNSAFTSLDTFPITLTDPTPSNQTLNIQFDNSVAGLTTDQQTTNGTISVVWNEIGGASQTNTLPVQATYINTPTSLNLSPADILQFGVMDPTTTQNKDILVNYTAASVDPTNVVLTGMSFTNKSRSVFTNLTSFPVALSAPGVDGAVSIGFDALGGTNGLAVGESTKANVIIKWTELGSGTTNETLLPIVGSYLAPATGLIENYGLSMPTNNVVFDSGASSIAAITAKREFISLDGAAYNKLYQDIEAAEPKLAGVTTFDGLVLKMRNAADFTGLTNGVNQLQVWFGVVDKATTNIVSTLKTDTFDCSDQTFAKHGFYQFKLSSAVTMPALGANEAFAFEVWFTADDTANQMDFWRGNVSSILGGAKHTTGNVSQDFPIAVSDPNPANDMVFALANGLSLVNSVGNVSVSIDGSSIIASFDGELGGIYALQRTTDLVLGTWSNVVENISGVGPINVTNDTTEANAFYRIILQ